MENILNYDYYKIPKLLLFIVFLFIVKSAFCQTPCAVPSNVGKKELADTYVVIKWNENSDVISYIIKWRKINEQYTHQNTLENISENEIKIIGLQPSTKYFYKVKSICSDGESDWSYEYNFITDMQNPSECNMNLVLKDYDSDHKVLGKTYFYIHNYEFSTGRLGEDVFIQNIKIIIDHSWTSDLSVNLTSPSGKTVNLIQNLPINYASGLGNKNDTLCLETLNLSDEACSNLQEEKYSYVGNFLPDASISDLYDETSPAGIWELEIIDKKEGNAGILKYFEIDFEPIICPMPKNFAVIPQSDLTAKLIWEPEVISDSIYVILQTNGNNQGFITDNTGEYPLIVYDPGLDYKVALRSKCNGNISSITCFKEIDFLCDSPELREDFDDMDKCEDPCNNDCINSNIWYNNSGNGKLWLLNSGKTLTENTGPDGDNHSFGNYIYIESSQSDCTDDTVAILESNCIQLGSDIPGCDMTFYYNMFGVDIDDLSLEISENGGNSWYQIFYQDTISENNSWKRKDIDLTSHNGKICNFRFIAKVKKDKNLGDIGLDDIIFYNAQLIDTLLISFFPDNDMDGYGADTTAKIYCGDQLINHVKNNIDCDDTNPDINPEAEEIKCNFIDENCNGMEDDTEGELDIIVTLLNIKNASCNGLNDGSVTLKIDNGIPPYQFIWSNLSQDSILTNAGVGKYWCTIFDQTGCGTITDTFYVDYDRSFNVNFSNIVLPSCSGKNDGTLELQISGGKSPYSYLWNTGDEYSVLTDIGPGFYSVSVTDSLGCKAESQIYDLKATANFNIGIYQKILPACNGSIDGKLEIKVDGGSAPYHYSWNNGMNNNLISNIGSGNYTCTVSDSENCFEVFGPVNLPEPAELKVNFNAIDHVTCIGQENGNIEISVKGGTAPYSYFWSKYEDNDFISLEDDIHELKSGNYSLYVFDNNGCSIFYDSILIKTIDSISVNIDSIADAACSKSNEGFIRVNAENGYQNYYYFWNNSITGQDYIQNLKTGIYGVVVTDDLGCKSVLNNIKIKNLNIPIKVSIGQENAIKCFDDKTASVIAIADSENQPFDFNWSAGTQRLKNINSDTIINLSHGQYDVTVTDNYGCVGTSDSIIILQPAKLTLNNIFADQILCNGDKDGVIELVVSGGTVPYFYTWNEDSKTGKKIIKLDEGKYFATITDFNNCILFTDTIEIWQPDSIVVHIISNPATNGLNNGSALLNIEGGVSPYFIQWDENTGYQNGYEATNLAKGYYEAEITDHNQCKRTIVVYINSIVATNEIFMKNFDLYPNPVQDILTFVNKSNTVDIQDIKVFSVDGIKQNVEINYSEQTTIDFSNVAAGIYFINVVTEDGVNYIGKIVVLK